jgi:hypothetical protein
VEWSGVTSGYRTAPHVVAEINSWWLVGTVGM